MLRTTLIAAATACYISTAAAEPFSPDQEAAIGALVRDYILENPEIIAEAVQRLQAREQQARLDRQKEALSSVQAQLVANSPDMVLGNPEGDVTIIEFFDYNCGYCKALFPTLLETVEDDGNVRVVLKEYPILGPSSETAARAALASRNQNKYQDFHTALLNHKGGLTDPVIDAIARSVGIDVEQLRRDMKADEIDEVISETFDLAQALEITGTPAIIIGDVVIPGALPKRDLKNLIDQNREANQS